MRISGVETSRVPRPLEETYDAAVLRTLPAVAAGIALLELVLAAEHVVLLDGTARVVTGALAAGTSVVLGACWLLLRRGLLPARLAQAAMTAMVLVVAVPAVVGMVLATQPRQTTTVMLAIVGAGAGLLSVRYLLAALYLVWGVWALGALLVGASAAWPHMITGLVVATVLSVAVSHVRRTAVRTLSSALDEAAAATVRDPLTGLANRRGLAMFGSQIVEHARREGDAVHCLFVDIDGLRRVNDVAGHDAGDEVIVSVAEALRSVTRATDVVARWGGDEFCVLGPGPGMAPLDLERRVREMVLAHTPVPTKLQPVRVSAGGAMLAPWDSGTLET
ncbi:MAG: diguanylate cyclase domain-containing protein, partial [Actinomycetes bacterium]